MYDFIWTFASGIAFITIIDSLVDLLDAVIERIKIENEERREKLKKSD